jgi:hypothetical protein
MNRKKKINKKKKKRNKGMSDQGQAMTTPRERSVNQPKQSKSPADGLVTPAQKQNIPRPEPASWERQRRKLGRV